MFLEMAAREEEEKETKLYAIRREAEKEELERK